MKIRNWKKDEGFTLIELLLVILIIAILAVIGISQFTNFAQDARDTSTKANLQILRNAIAKMNGMMRVRCNVTTSEFPGIDNLRNNDITHNNTPCTFAQLGTGGATGSATNDKIFVSTGIPPNPWSNTTADAVNPPAGNLNVPNAIINCVGQAPGTLDTTAGNVDIGWCYDSDTGRIWANSDRSTSRVKENTF